jgi:hypothetical protein
LSHESFIQNLKNPEFLLNGCRVFWGKYEDNVSFALQILWQDFFKGGEIPNEYVILGGAEALLLKWNRMLYQNKPRLMTKIEDDLEQVFNSTFPLLKPLYNVQLGNLNLNNYLEDVGKLYESYRQKNSIGMTGASKVLYFIYPELFVAWDRSIRDYYHKHDPSHNKKHQLGSFECYIDFIKMCNDIAADLLKGVKLNDLAQKHPAYVEYRQIRSLPKMLDECNWCRIYKKEKW